MSKEHLLHIILGTSSTILGVILTLVYDQRDGITSWLALNSSKNLRGTWFCFWEEDHDKWIKDTIRIDSGLGKIKMNVISSGCIYKLEMTGKMIHGLIIGEFKSLHPDSISTGNINLKLNPPVTLMYGCHIGPIKQYTLVSGRVIFTDDSKFAELKRDFKKNI